MKLALAGVVLFAAVTSLTAQARKPDYYLDVPGQSLSGIPPDWVVPSRNSISGRSHPTTRNPLRLTLISVDRTDFVYGEYFIYEVLIENTGIEPVALPWSPDAGAFAQPTPEMPALFVSGSVYLQVEPGSGQDTLALLDSQALYGSPGVPRSRLMLQPGQTALIRVPAQWSATMEQGRAAILRQPDGEVRLRAVFSIYVDDFPLTRSSNTIPVRVRPRRPQ